ncbi:MAG: DNA mismatch repair endonuclease MutL [Syntrophomonadaceae bacterium]|nr:DNA mismatch repair endonuclease MutL [Syntrophomonadaceae bacterium]
MSKIKLLDQHLIDKIAAGEVVERPASVVKELVENGIDAGSTCLEIEIRNGGIDYIQVSDNGAGIEEDDLVLAFARHATSKLETEDDLFSVESMGFRGEALSSIAAVSRVELCSNAGDGGNCIRVEGGQVVSCQPAPVPPGTTVIVRNLFFNTPARRKFLKSPVTEGNHVYDTVVRLALSHPEISFCFRNEHRMVFMTSGNGDLREAVLAIFGGDFTRRLLDIEFQYGDIKVSGLIGRPDLTRKNRKGQIFAVNSRVVRNSMLSASLEDAYQGMLVSRERPVGIIFLTIPHKQVDVNVHPQKAEVRFHDEKTVYTALKTAVRQELLKIADPVTTAETYLYHEPASEIRAPVSSPYISNNSGYQAQPVLHDDLLLFETTDERTPPIKVYGQWQDSYLICEIDGNLSIIDQHAAHERLLYNRLIANPAERLCQELAVPVALELQPDLLRLVEARIDHLAELGYHLNRLGERTVVVRSMPAMTVGGEVEALMEILEAWQDQALSEEAVLDSGLKILACKGAVKAGQRLQEREIIELIGKWAVTENRNFCPHGRPVCYTIDRTEIERLLKR